LVNIRGYVRTRRNPKRLRNSRKRFCLFRKPNRLVPRLVFAGTMQLAKGALETLNLAFVIDLLSLRELQRLEHFLHFIQRMFKLLNHPIDLLDRVRDGGHLVRCLLVAPIFPARWLAMALFVVPFFAVFRLVPLFVRLPWLSLLDGRFRGFGGSVAGGIGSWGRGQGTARLAAPRVASASASGATPAPWGGGIGGSG
jgi:hypothetical protein